MLNSILDLNFQVSKKADFFRYANGNDIRIVNLAPIALFSNSKLTTSSGKHLEDFSQAHIVYLMYKLISSANDSDDLSIGFDCDCNRRRNEFSDNKKIQDIFHLRIMLEDVLGFAKHQEKGTNSFRYKLTIIGSKEDGIIDKALDIVDARIKIGHILWYVPHYSPSKP